MTAIGEDAPSACALPDLYRTIIAGRSNTAPVERGSMKLMRFPCHGFDGGGMTSIGGYGRFLYGQDVHCACLWQRGERCSVGRKEVYGHIGHICCSIRAASLLEGCAKFLDAGKTLRCVFRQSF